MAKINVDKIELKNFYSYGGQWQTIDLREGVNIVLGHDKDKERSNGAGKTSFLEAIPFALFGQTSKGVSLPKIVNWKNGKQCEVKLHFRKDGVSYMIHRGIKPGIIELVKDGVPVPKLSDKRVFQMELEQDLIGMDYKATEAILFQNANNTISLFNTPKAEKRRFIEKFFNLEIYSKVNEQTNSKLGNVVKRLSEIDMEIGFKVRRIEELTNKIESSIIPNLDTYQSSVDGAMSRLGQFNADHIKEFNESPKLEKELEVFRAERTILQDDLIIKKAELSKVEDQLNLLKGEKNTIEKRNVTIGDLTEQREKLGKVKTVLKTLDGLDDEQKKVTDIISGLRSEKGDLDVERAGVVSDKTRVESDLKQWTDYESTDEAVCPTCFQNVDLKHIEEHVNTLVSGYNQKLDELNIVIELIDKSILKVKNKISAEETTLEVIDNKIAKKRQLETHLSTLSGVEDKQKEFDENIIRIGQIKEEMTELEGTHKTIQDDIDEMNSKIEQTRLHIDEKQTLFDEFKELQRQQIQLGKDLETETKIYASQKEIHDRIVLEYEDDKTAKTLLESEISEFDAEKKKLNVMKDYLEYIKETLKDTNVKQYAIGNIIPFLQQQTNHYLSETGHNYYIELDAWLDGTIKGYGVGECDFGNMSGGEGKSIDLALKFTMMDVARRQAGSYLDILVLDELLDSSIDAHGIEKTFDIIRMKQREDNLKVFVVSHREEVADFGVDNTYKVTKEDGLSTIEVV